jgi:hypothetical protein
MAERFLTFDLSTPIDECDAKENAARSQTGPAPYNATIRTERERVTREWPVDERQETDQRKSQRKNDKTDTYGNSLNRSRKLG